MNGSRRTTLFSCPLRGLAAALAFAAVLLIVNFTPASASWPPDGLQTTEHEQFVYVDFAVENHGYEALAGGGLIHVRIYRPRGTASFPAVIWIPAPLRTPIVPDSGRNAAGPAAEMNAAEYLAQNGVATVLYNPPGRGFGEFASAGPDDSDGYVHQDALASLIRAVGEVPFIDAKNIGLCTDGAGLAAAAGALARNPDLSARYLIDVEGPFDNLEMSGYTWKQITGEAEDRHMVRESLYYKHWATAVDSNPENLEWWRVREPRTNAALMHIKYYQRVQFDIDRNQPPGYYAHALRMYEAVRAAGIANTRFNNGKWNEPLPPRRVPDMIPGRLADYNHAVEDYVLDLAKMPD